MQANGMHCVWHGKLRVSMQLFNERIERKKRRQLNDKTLATWRDCKYDTFHITIANAVAFLMELLAFFRCSLASGAMLCRVLCHLVCIHLSQCNATRNGYKHTECIANVDFNKLAMHLDHSRCVCVLFQLHLCHPSLAFFTLNWIRKCLCVLCAQLFATSSESTFFFIFVVVVVFLSILNFIILHPFNFH